MTYHCQNCGREIEIGEEDSPETWHPIFHYREDLPYSKIPIGTEQRFCSRICLAIYLIRMMR